eukprot:210823-Prymnesium_polylepis.1
MPFRLCCSARQRLQLYNTIAFKLHVRRRGRTQRWPLRGAALALHDCAPKRRFSSDPAHPRLPGASYALRTHRSVPRVRAVRRAHSTQSRLSAALPSVPVPCARTERVIHDQ